MDIKERVVESVSVLDLSGKIVLGEGDVRRRLAGACAMVLGVVALAVG